MKKEKSDEILEELKERISSICRDDEELKGIIVFVHSDKYRLELIDFLNKEQEKKNNISPGQLIVQALKISNKEKNESYIK